MEKRLTRAPAARVERRTLAGGELLVELCEGVATITLNRPDALNALSSGMLVGLAGCLDAWGRDDRVDSIVLRGAGDRAFCAGGDIRALRRTFMSGERGQLRFFEIEYALDLRIHRYPKPVAALIDGIVMGGGMGISQGATLRVVGERTRMAMPETAIGWFPDVGASYFLSRLPGKLGLYLGLAGPTIGAADALYCGLADVYLERAAIDDFSREEARRKGRSRIAGGELERLRPAIDEHFGLASVEAIVASLEREDRAPWKEWAATTRAALGSRSPTLLKVTFEQLRRGANLSLEDCFEMELGLAGTCLAHGDFLEGVRALLEDKDNRPRWNPPALAQVSAHDVERFFHKRET